jgi:mono/diheme cytochrome c family protein
MMFWGLVVSGFLLGHSSTAADDQSSGWTAPPRAARRANPMQPDDNSRAVGRRLFVAHCAACHGGGGRGDGPSALSCNPRPSDLTDPAVTSETDGELFWKISTGRKPMPAYEPRLSDEQRWHVVNFLHAIAPPPATQPADRQTR